MRGFSKLSLVAAVVFTLGIQPAAATDPGSSGPAPLEAGGKPLFFARAHGVEAFVGSTVHVPKVAQVSLGGGCSSVVVGTKQRDRTVVSVSTPPFATSGTVHTTAGISETHGTASAEVQDVTLLGGLIMAATVKAVSTTTEGAGGIEFSAGGSSLVNAVVNGELISGTPPPNTSIEIADLGRVVLNEQIPRTRGSSGGLEVNMIHVFVTLENSLGIPVGTEIIVSHAESGVAFAPGEMLLGGMAYGVSAMAARTTSIDPVPLVELPCLGTKGKVVEDSVLSLDAPPTAVTGTMTVTAQGTVAPSSVIGETTATVQSVNLLDGMVTGDMVVADAGVSSDGTIHTFTDQSTFTNLQVSGHPEITDSVPPNTEVSLGGWADLRLHKVIQTSRRLEVRMIEIVVRAANPFGLPTGSVIRAAVASVAVR